MNKRAMLEFRVILFTFYKLIVLLIIALSLYFFVTQFMKTNIDVFDVESEVFAYGVLNSPGGVSYLDKTTGRLYPGTINLDDISILSKRMKEGFYYEKNRYIAAEIVIMNKTKKPITKPIYYNKEFYEIWYPLGATGVRGVGSAKIKEKTYPIILLKEGKKTQGFMKLTVAIPNS